ncbi:MAG: alpha/beta hydrolase [Planctomycetales bacterium]
MTRGRRPITAVFVGVLTVVAASSAFGDEGTPRTSEPTAIPTKTLVYKVKPHRTLTVYYPDGWKPSDKRSTLVILRCNIPVQREHFRRLGMVIVKPQTAPVNSGQLPKLSLQKIASLPRPRHQVEDTKSAVRFLRANAATLGIDSKKIVATGTSGGGDLALQASINRSFEDANDDLSISPRPDALVLFCPAFDGIDIWFVKTETLLQRTKEDAPAFVAHMKKFARSTPEGYSVPLDHRVELIKQAATLGKREGIDDEEIARFQKVLELFNVRDWQLLHPVADALKMSASRILPKGPLPPTLIMHGDRDHLLKYQQAFVAHAREAGQQFELKVFKGAGHSFMMQPVFEKPSTQEAEQFLRQHGYLPNVGVDAVDSPE